MVNLLEAKKHAACTIQRQGPGFRILEGEVYSFRPTNPGRSPGIGHSNHH